jgi:feruloyl esterase
MVKAHSGVIAASLTVAALFGAWSTAPAAQVPAASVPAAVIPPARSCSSLTGVDFSRAAPGTVTSAAVVKVKLTTGNVAFCDARGVIAPHIHFEIRLPAATWHGQYLQEGCGTFCGYVKLSNFPLTGFTCGAADSGELALATDDEGHTSAPADASWAKNSQVARVVFGLTSENSLYHMSRAIIAAYYGRPAAYSYYDGCSDGGREALMLAERYPADFNGIIAGAAAINLAASSGMFWPWMVRANTAPDGHQIVTSEVIPALHAAVIRACGNREGIITDPRRCGFNPASIQCRPGERASSCLTPAQVVAVREFYLGPTDPQGQSLYYGGEPYGSELGWIGGFVEPATDKGAPANSEAALLALSYLRYLAFEPNPPTDFSLADVKFTRREFHAVNRLGEALYNADDPDLRAFAARGGKLIMYQGWADQSITPWSSLDYYAAVERASGGFGASQSFSRLYMIPAAYHCLFAPDGDTNMADFLTKLIAWVQVGAAPGAVQADTVNSHGQTVQHLTVLPYDALAPVRPAPGSLNGHYRYIGAY